MRSKANADKPARRAETFCNWSTALGIVLAFLLLLAFLFPKESLLELLNRSADVSPAVLRYRESILRLNPDDHHQRLRLAEDLTAAGNFHKSLDILDGFEAESLSPQNRARCLELRCRSRKGILLALAADDPERARIAGAFSDELLALIDLDPEPQTARRLAQEALEVGDAATAARLRQRFETAEEALSRGDYRKSAQLYFRAMSQTQEMSERREQFQHGVEALQAGNLIAEALEQGEAHLGPLGSDRPTLLFLSRIALAADRPDKAEVLIKKALGMDTRSPSRERGKSRRT